MQLLLACPPACAFALLHSAKVVGGVLQMMLLLSGRVTCERPAGGERGTRKQTAVVHPGAIIGAAALLCSTSSREVFTAASTCTVLAISMHELQNVLHHSVSAYLDLLFAGSKALAYHIRRFVSLGLNRVWLRSGDVAYRQGDKAESMYVVISGRLRLVSQQRGTRGELHVDEEVSRGETIGAVWAVTGGDHDTSAVAVRGCELVRLSRGSFEVRPLLFGMHDLAGARTCTIARLCICQVMLRLGKESVGDLAVGP